MPESVNDEERRCAALAIRGWIELSLTEKEKKALATGILSLGVLGDDVEKAIALGMKLGIGDLIVAQCERFGELAVEHRAKAGVV